MGLWISDRGGGKWTLSTNTMATKVNSVVAVMKMSMGILFLPNLNRCNRLLNFLKGRLADFANICKEKHQDLRSHTSIIFCSYITCIVISHHSTISFPHHDMEIFCNRLGVIWTGDVQIDRDSYIYGTVPAFQGKKEQLKYMEIPKWSFLPSLCIKWFNILNHELTVTLGDPMKDYAMATSHLWTICKLD